MESTTTTENNGVVRQRVGRPKVKEPAKTRSIKLTDADWERFRAIGGTKWLRHWINDK